MDRLLNILKEEIELYKIILDVSKNKNILLKENKVKELEATTKEEEGLVAQVIAKEKERIQEVKDICKRYGKPEKSLKIEELCEFVDNSKEELLQAKKEIMELLKELKEINDLNETLIKSSLEYVNFAVNMLMDAKPNATYQPGGVQENKQQRNLFDMKL